MQKYHQLFLYTTSGRNSIPNKTKSLEHFIMENATHKKEINFKAKRYYSAFRKWYYFLTILLYHLYKASSKVKINVKKRKKVSMRITIKLHFRRENFRNIILMYN